MGNCDEKQTRNDIRDIFIRRMKTLQSETGSDISENLAGFNSRVYILNINKK